MSIVLGYDESPGATRALRYAIDLARLLDDTLVLVYGAEPPGRVGEEFTEHLAALAERGRAALDNAVELATAAGVATTVELVDEKPAQALLDSADKHDARLIVVGTYGESPLRGAIRFHTAQTVALVEPAGAVCASGEGPAGGHERVASRFRDTPAMGRQRRGLDGGWSTPVSRQRLRGRRPVSPPHRP